MKDIKMGKGPLPPPCWRHRRRAAIYGNHHKKGISLNLYSFNKISRRFMEKLVCRRSHGGRLRLAYGVSTDHELSLGSQEEFHLVHK